VCVCVCGRACVFMSTRDCCVFDCYVTVIIISCQKYSAKCNKVILFEHWIVAMAIPCHA